MHKQHIKGMLKLLRPLLEDEKKAKSILKRYWKDRIALVWELKDVHRAANERSTALTDAEAREILKELRRRYNPQYGISWETVVYLILDSGKGRDLTKAELKQFIENDVITIQTGRKPKR